MSRLTQRDALAAFRARRLAQGYAPSTLALEARLLRAALGKHALGRQSLARVTRADLEAYLARRAQEVRATTLARELGVLVALFAFLAAEGLIGSDPAAGLRARPAQARPPLLLSRASVALLLQAASLVGGGQRSPGVRRARALRNRALLELLYGLGLRASETAAVRITDLDLSGEASLLVRRVKRGKPRRLPLPRAAGEAIAHYLREGRPHLVKAGASGEELLFLSERGTRISGSEVGRIVTGVAKLAGLEAHPHALRRALATHFVQDGVSLAVVREVLGHVRLDTTQRYVVLGRDDLRRAVDKLERARRRE